MNTVAAAILAVLVTLGPSDRYELARPMRVGFQVADGGSVSGMARAWSIDGIEGDFGTHAWRELRPVDAWNVLRRLVDRQSAGQWIAAGEALLAVDGAETFVRRAFDEALQRNPEAAALESAARARAAAAAEARRQAATAENALRTDSPEGRPWPATPWPPMDAGARGEAMLEVIADAEAVIPAGENVAQVRLREIVVRGVLSNEEAARLAVRLEENLHVLQDLLGVPRDANHFWGAAVVLVAADADHYRVIQEVAFGQRALDGEAGMAHFVGPKVFVLVRRDLEHVEDVVVEAARGLAHGFMHRLHAPVRLPAWANEGIAEWSAGQLSPEPRSLVRRREVVQQWMRGGGSILPVFVQGYGSAVWERRDLPAPAVGRLTVELMMRNDITRFRAWVTAIKQGEEWREALGSVYRVPLEQLVPTVHRYFQTND